MNNEDWFAMFFVFLVMSVLLNYSYDASRQNNRTNQIRFANIRTVGNGQS